MDEDGGRVSPLPSALLRNGGEEYKVKRSGEGVFREVRLRVTVTVRARVTRHKESREMRRRPGSNSSLAREPWAGLGGERQGSFGSFRRRAVKPGSE